MFGIWHAPQVFVSTLWDNPTSSWATTFNCLLTWFTLTNSNWFISILQLRMRSAYRLKLRQLTVVTSKNKDILFRFIFTDLQPFGGSTELQVLQPTMGLLQFFLFGTITRKQRRSCRRTRRVPTMSVLHENNQHGRKQQNLWHSCSAQYLWLHCCLEQPCEMFLDEISAKRMLLLENIYKIKWLFLKHNLVASSHIFHIRIQNNRFPPIDSS